MRCMSVRVVVLASAILALPSISRDAFAATLQSLAAARFGHLTRAETRMLDAALAGETAWCGPGRVPGDAANDPSKARDWGAERNIRAALIRWLYVDPEAVKTVALSGVSVVGARVLEEELDLSRVRMDLPLQLRNCAIAKGVRLEGADTRSLDFRNSWVGPISARGLVAHGDLLLRDGFHCDGEVSLNFATIEGSLDCTGGTILTQGEVALAATGTTFEGNVLFSNFETEELISINLAKIGGNLVFLRTQFKGGKKRGLEAIGTEVQGALVWAEIGPKPLDDVLLDLTFTKVGGLGDYADSWPKYILMNDFVYDKFDEPDQTPKDLPTRLIWLRKQPWFRAQPYLQLARIFSANGRDDDATEVLIEKDKQQRADTATHRGWLAKQLLLAWSWFLRSTIGYGHEPMRALGWSAVIVAIGWMIFWRGYHVALMVPSEKDAYESLGQTGEVPAYYQRFNSLVYSLETFLPLVDLHQGKYWSPSGKSVGQRRAFARFLPWYLRFQILSGWLLSTMFVAGLTGLVHKD